MSIHLASRRGILGARAHLPQDVVFRSFASETVVLNLTTGRYHSLNPTGGSMFEAMIESPTVEEAARRLALLYELPQQQIGDDLCAFCVSLHDRGLIALEDPA